MTTFGLEIMSKTLDLIKVRVRLGFKCIKMKLLVHNHAGTLIKYPSIGNITETLMNSGVRLADDLIDCDMIRGIEVLIGIDYLLWFIMGQHKIKDVDIFVSSEGLIPYGSLPK